ncbi:ABC transporter ATP-binding protein [Laceyella putida]|uniref:ABC transporter ATP-binding protein n=1 Tax=Laceyella putida TaxID=110101 RepID=A0ABW2RFB6_9BACL
MLLEVKELYKKFGSKAVIENLNLHLHSNEIVALMGQNGVGKTTLLNILTGLIYPDSGDVTIEGKNLFNQVEIRKQIGYIPVDGFFYDHLNAYENLEMVACLYGVKPKKTDIEQLLEQVGLYPEDAKRPTGTYSSGMKQKLNFASGMIHQPKLLVLDEPFNALDPQTTSIFKNLLKDFVNKGKGILFTSHLPETILQLADRVVVMSNKKIESELTLEKSLRVEQLLNWFNSAINIGGYQ